MITNIKQKALIIFLFLQVIIQASFLLDYDLNSVKFLPRVISLVFIALIVNGVCFGVLFFLFKRKLFVLPLALALTLSNFLIFLNLYNGQLAFQINQFLGDKLINDIFKIRFINASVNDGNLSWGIALGTYIGVMMMTYGQWFIKKKTDFDNKVEKQLIFMGLGLYLVLFPFVFVFTHFTFVGSNYQYMQALIKYTHSATEIYEAQNQRDTFNIKELKWFPDLKTAVSYYKSPTFKEQVATSKNKKEFYNSAIGKIDQIFYQGWKDKPPVKYNEIERFHDWVQISYNFNFDGLNAEKKTVWYSEISPVIGNAREKDEDLLRHSVLYLRELKDGSVYAMIDFNRTFKNHKMNYIFNFFFILYHILYIGLFLYLITLHSKKNIGGKHV